MSIRSGFFFLSVAALLATTFSAHGQMAQPLTETGDAARGKGLAYTCTGCHGVDSAVNAYPMYHVPKLGGQNADYIEIALQGYRNGSRAHPTMHAQASEMSDQDIADLAAWFGSIEAEPATGISSAGRQEVLAGQTESTTCQACHGTAGIAASPQFPNIAGQHATYLLQAMQQYLNGKRDNAIMAPLVSTFDEDTLEQIAAYYAAQAGLYPTGR